MSSKRIRLLVMFLIASIIVATTSYFLWFKPVEKVEPIKVINPTERPLLLGDSILAGFGVWQDPLRETTTIWPQAKNYAHQGDTLKKTINQFYAFANDQGLASKLEPIPGVGFTTEKPSATGEQPWVPNKIFILAGANDYAKQRGYGSFPDLAKDCVKNGCSKLEALNERELINQWKETLISEYRISKKLYGKAIPMTILGYPQFAPSTGEMNFTIYTVKHYTIPEEKVIAFYDQWLLVNNLLQTTVSELQKEHRGINIDFKPLGGILEDHFLGGGDSWVIEPPSHYTGHLAAKGLGALFQTIANLDGASSVFDPNKLQTTAPTKDDSFEDLIPENK